MSTLAQFAECLCAVPFIVALAAFAFIVLRAIAHDRKGM